MADSMNTPSNKKAVHVKWAGKTIALGTFPLAEADEKCARAKALTRAWRSTMRPKPSREWVMNELERLNVRVVSGRPSKDASGSDDDEAGSGGTPRGVRGGGAGGGTSKKSGMNNANPLSANIGGDFQGNSSSITASLLNAAEFARGLGIDANTFLNQQRRSSSLTMSLFDNDNRDSGLTAAAGGDGGSNNNNHRPLVGGGSAAAYEAARADFYRKLSQEKNSSGTDNLNANESGMGAPLPGSSRRLSSLSGLFSGDFSGDAFNSHNGNGNGTGRSNTGVGGGVGGAGGSSSGSFGLSVNPNAHYEMLKLHHMNLLNEIQETTLMMNLYQQQQIQQRQQQKKLEQEQALLAQQQLLARNNSIGHGGFNAQTNNSISAPDTSPVPPPQATKTAENNLQGTSKQEDRSTASATSSELNEHEKQLQRIKEEIEERKRQLLELEQAASAKAASKEVAAEMSQHPKSKGEESDASDASDAANGDVDDSDEGSENNGNQKDVNGRVSDISQPPMKKTKITVL